MGIYSKRKREAPRKSLGQLNVKPKYKAALGLLERNPRHSPFQFLLSQVLPLQLTATRDWVSVCSLTALSPAFPPSFSLDPAPLSKSLSESCNQTLCQRECCMGYPIRHVTRRCLPRYPAYGWLRSAQKLISHKELGGKAPGPKVWWFVHRSLHTAVLLGRHSQPQGHGEPQVHFKPWQVKAHSLL